MSDQTTTEDKSVSSSISHDTIIKEAVTNAINEVVPKLREEFKSQPQPTGLTPEQVQSMLVAERKNLADQITGRKREPEVDPVLAQFVQSPTRILEQMREISREDARALLEEREAEAKAIQQTEYEMKKAFDEVMGSRSDVTANEATKQVWASCYQGTDPSKSHAERMREATVKYDQLLDTVGADRSKLSSIASVSGGTGALPVTAATMERSREDSDREYQREKHQAYMKAMGMD